MAGCTGKNHMQFQMLKDSITAVKDTALLHRLTGVSQIWPQLWEMGVKIFPTRCPAGSNVVGLLGEQHQIKEVTKAEFQKLGKVQTVAGPIKHDVFR